MNESTATVVVSVLLIVIPLAWTAWMWIRRHSVRSLLRGISAALVPAGLWLVGVTRLIAIWLQQTVDWIRTTRMGTTGWIGVCVAAVGVVGWLAAGYLEPVTRKQAKTWRAEQRRRTQTAAAAGTSKSQVSARKQSDSKADQVRATANPDKAGFTDEDRDLMNLLKDRGID